MEPGYRPARRPGPIARPDGQPRSLVLQILRRLLAAASLDERRCAFCRGVYSPQSSSDAPFCPVCRSLLEPRNQDSCPRCGQPLSVPTGPAPCGDCLTSPPPWRHFRFYAPYAGAFRSLLLRGKFRRDLAVLHLVGRLLAQACADLPVPDAVVPYIRIACANAVSTRARNSPVPWPAFWARPSRRFSCGGRTPPAIRLA